MFAVVLAVLFQVVRSAPLLTQVETINRVQNGEKQRSYLVLFNENGPSFGMNKEKLQGWLQETVGAEPENVQHIYSITENFRGYAIWANSTTLDAIRAHEGTKWVEEDSVVRMTQTWLSRIDWGQMRSLQKGAGNLTTSPAGYYTNGTYAPPEGTGWSWATTPNKPINNGSRAKIWIVDTGVLQNHTEFRTAAGSSTSRVSTSQDYVTPSTGGTDCQGHGTHCAGSAAGLNRGLAVAADIGNVRVLNCQGSGTNANVIAGFNYVANNQKSGATNILSASLGGAYSSTSNAAITNAAKAGVVPVVAAGNDNNADCCNTSPASTPEAVTVGAISAVNNARASFSNTGSCMNVFAPGVNIHSSYYSSTTAYTQMSGTSMATPLTAGAIALYGSQFTTPVTYTQVQSAIGNFGSRGFVTGTLLSGTPNIIINANWN